jgi:hypothetical protein
LTDDGRPPLAASGLKLKDRLETIAASLERVEQGMGRDGAQGDETTQTQTQTHQKRG